MMTQWRIQLILLGLIFLGALGCSSKPVVCSAPVLPSVNELDALPADAPVRFPLENYRVTGPFHMESWPTPGIYHGAEDIEKDAGTPVYAMADGIISYSGPRDGYGWLVIIDHPQLRVYSLYGHLSPSHWARETGPVLKGELIGELGHGLENGYNDKVGFIEPHLHFMIRVGQRADYPRSGDRRWMAGWMKNCPENHGWVRPSKFILEYAAHGEAYLAEIALLADQHTSSPDPVLFALPIGFLALLWNGWCRSCIRSKMQAGHGETPDISKIINPWKLAPLYKQFLEQCAEKVDGLYVQYIFSAIVFNILVSVTVVLWLNLQDFERGDGSLKIKNRPR